MARLDMAWLLLTRYATLRNPNPIATATDRRERDDTEYSAGDLQQAAFVDLTVRMEAVE